METGLVWLHGIFDVLYLLSYVLIPLTFIYWICKWQKTEQAEEVLWQNQERLNLVLQAADMGQWEWTIQTGKIYWSASLERMFGMTPGTFDGRYETIVGMIHSEDREWVTQAIYRAVYERDDYQVEFRFVKPDGTIRWALSRGRVFYDQMGNPIQMIGVDLDITERKQAEAALEQLNQELETRVEQRTAALQESKERWQLALRGSNDGIWDWSIKTNQVFVSTRWKEMHEFTGDEINNICCEKWSNRIHPDDRDRVLTALDNHLTRKSPVFREEYRVQHEDGSYRWILDRGQALWDEAGKAIRMAGSESDISARKQIEQALREREAGYRAIVEDQTELIARFSPDTTVVFVNEAYCRYFGLQREEIIGKSYQPVIFEEDQETVAQLIQSMSAENPTVTIENRVVIKGEMRWTQWINRMLFDEQGQFLEVQSVGRDITELKRTEETLRISEERLKLALEGSGDGLWDWNVVTGEVYLSSNWLTMLGYAEDEFPLHVSTWERLIHPDDKPWVMERLNAHFEDSSVPYAFDYRVLTKSGEWKWLANYGRVVAHDENGVPLRMVGTHQDISERKQTEEQLCILSERLSLAIKSGGFGIWEYDFVQDKQIWDDRVYELYGVTPDNFVNTFDTWLNYLHPGDRDEVLQTLQQVVHEDKEYDTEFRIIRPSGEIRFLKTCGILQRDKRGNPVHIIGVNFDITTRKLAEESLRESERRFATLADASPVAIFRFDTSGNCVYVNNRWSEMTGRPAEEGLGMGWIQTLHPEDIDRTLLKWSQWTQVLNTERLFQNEARILCPDGRILWIYCQMLPETNPDSTISGYVGVLADISERKQAEEALDKYAHEVEDLYNNAPCGYHSLDSEGRMINVNETELKWLGYTREEMIGKPFTDFITQAGHSVFEQNYPRFKERGWIKDLEYNMVCKDGTIFPVLLNATAVKSEDGTYLYNRATLFDLRDRKRAEQELQELNTAMQNAVEGISRLDADGRYTSVNRAYANMCGYEPEELIGQLWQQTVYSEDVPDMLATYQQMLQTGKVNAETRGVRKDGSCFYKQVTMISIHDEQGNVTGNHCFMKDISDRKYAEVQLRQTNEQLARATRLRDEFLANMSHELRTPLNAILGMSEGLQEGVFGSINERQVKAIATIERSGRHLLELINDILDLSKIESGKLELQISNVPVRSLCDASLSFIRQMALKKNIHLITRIPDNVGSIQADNRRLRQVLINLLNNAVKFTPEGGSVTLEVRIEEVQEPRSREVKEAAEVNFSLSSPSLLSPSSPSSSHICFCVTDTGIGIAPDDVGKLFQAFVQIDSSLNRQYSGTGLGLALVQRIANLHEGTVSVESEVGRGSCFTVRIPYDSTGEVTRMSVATPLPTAPFPLDKAPVLIIEDSISAADQIARYLSENGMQSIIYPHGKGACEEVLRVQPSLVILDIQLPYLSGWNVLTQLKTHPQIRDIPVLIVSVVDERSRGLAMGASEYLVKPITRSELQASLRKLQGSIMTETTTLIVVPESAPESPLILLAEDNLANIDTISGYLESRGYRLILARDGRQAIELTKSQRPNLIVMDIQMPGMDGLEAMHHIRAEEQIHIPIIALTALAMPSDQEKCLEVGANKYLTKPIKLKQLVGTIQQLLSQSKGNLQ